MLLASRQWITKILFVFYCLFILWGTLLTRTLRDTRAFDLRFMWSYREMLAGDPNWKKDVIQNIQNVLFYIPFGLLHPIKKWKAVLTTSVLYSVVIELIQYIGGYGLVELDDVICNTLGTMIGFWIWTGFAKKFEEHV